MRLTVKYDFKSMIEKRSMEEMNVEDLNDING